MSQWIYRCVLIIMFGFMNMGISQGQAQSEVLDLFSPDSVTIVSIRAKSDLPIFTNPLLTIEYRLNDRVTTQPTHLEIREPRRLLNRDPDRDEAPQHCNLLMVGLSDSEDRYVSVLEVQERTGLIDVFAFCQDFNLPGDPERGLPFPTSQSSLGGDNNRRIESLPTVEVEKLTRLIERATNDTCGVGLDSIATQFAIFILNAPTEMQPRMWERFMLRAGNPFYVQYRDAIYCLLEEAGITTPEPTPTPTATATASVTPIPAQAGLPSPTPPPYSPLDEPSSVDNLSVGQALGLLVGGSLALLVLGSMVRFSTRRQLLIGIVVIVILVSLLLVIGLQATRGQAPTPSEVDTAAPGLLFVILLDDSSTMSLEGARNSLETALQVPGSTRDLTDPEFIRSRAAVDLIKQLASDPAQTHTVAVMSYARQAEDPVWLSAQPDVPDNVFLTVGGDSATPDELYSRLLSKRFYPQGPGDTISAIQKEVRDRISEEIDRLNTEGVRRKPVILLITDDVPMQTWDQGPFVAPENPTWQAYSENLITELRPLADANAYEGYCATADAGGEDNTIGLTFVTFAMGAANWVNTNGSISESGDGDYFQNVARALGSTFLSNLENPFVVRIDPLFEDDGRSRLENDLRDATRGLVAELRCQWRLVPQQIETLSDESRYSIEVSSLFKSITLMVDVPLTVGDGPIAIVLSDQNTLTQQPIVNDWLLQRRYIWTIERDAINEVWAGEWEIRIPGGQSSVSASAVLDLNGLAVDIDSDTDNLSPTSNLNLLFALRKDNQPLSDDLVLGNLTAQLSGTSDQEVVLNPQGDGIFVSNLTLTRSGPYNTSVIVALNQQAGIPLPASIRLAGPPLTVGAGFQLGDTNPVDGASWLCDPESLQQTFSVEFSLGRDDRDRESVLSYTQMNLYYPVPAPGSSATPFATLQPVIQAGAPNESRFQGQFNCRQLALSDGQQMSIEAVFPGDIRVTRVVNFNYSPTLTPVPATATSTPRITTTPLPTVTPAPNWANPVSDLVSPANLPVVLMIVIPLCLAFSGWVLLRAWHAYENNFLGLSQTTVTIENVAEGEFIASHQPALGPWRRLSPFHQHQTYFSNTATAPDDLKPAEPKAKAEQTALFRIEAVQGGRVLRIRAYSSQIRVNGKAIAIRSQESYTDSRQVSTTVTADPFTYVFVNRKAGRR
jgi:hypothetical protein